MGGNGARVQREDEPREDDVLGLECLSEVDGCLYWMDFD